MTYDGYTKYDARVASTYDLDRESEAHWRAENAFVERYGASHRLGRVLDMPVGTGRLLGALDGAEHIVGLDVSADMLAVAEEARQRLGRVDVVLVRGDALATGFETQAFDTVLCFRLLHLLPPPLVPAVLRELRRVCRGRVLLQVYVAREVSIGAALRSLLAKAWGRLPWRRNAPGATPWAHIQSFRHTGRFLDGCVAEAGLRLVARHTLGEYNGARVEVLELAA